MFTPVITDAHHNADDAYQAAVDLATAYSTCISVLEDAKADAEVLALLYEAHKNSLQKRADAHKARSVVYAYWESVMATSAMTEAREAVLNALTWDYIYNTNAYPADQRNPWDISLQIARDSLRSAGIDQLAELDRAWAAGHEMSERVGVDFRTMARAIHWDIGAVMDINLAEQEASWPSAK